MQEPYPEIIMVEPPTPCEEMHCALAATEHNYGDPGCSWILCPEGVEPAPPTEPTTNG